MCIDLYVVFDSTRFCVVSVVVVPHILNFACQTTSFICKFDCYNKQACIQLLPLHHKYMCYSDVLFLNKSVLEMALSGECWEPIVKSEEP